MFHVRKVSCNLELQESKMVVIDFRSETELDYISEWFLPESSAYITAAIFIVAVTWKL
jgi:hypothetical protein